MVSHTALLPTPPWIVPNDRLQTYPVPPEGGAGRSSGLLAHSEFPTMSMSSATSGFGAARGGDEFDGARVDIDDGAVGDVGAGMNPRHAGRGDRYDVCAGDDLQHLLDGVDHRPVARVPAVGTGVE